MRNFYSVLQVSPKASEAQIKAAFRTLAKTCHPDLKPGDKGAEEIFQEAEQAYRFLSNPETRKMYDAFLAERRAIERQRLRRSAITMSASFVLTAAAVILTVLWLNVASLPWAGGSVSAGTRMGTTVRGHVAVARASRPASGTENMAQTDAVPAEAASPQ
jgi:curved DNA-binding protein CbpA